MPMSARIDHHSLVITGQMSMSQSVCTATLYVPRVLVTIMDNVRPVLMDTTYQEQLVRSVMLIALLVLVVSLLNAADAQKDSSWMLPKTQLSQRLEILENFVDQSVLRIIKVPTMS